jgi:CRISPR system Cascade subunit CasB
LKYQFLSFEEQKVIQRWHHWLDNNRGDRARLRRAERPEDLLLTEAFFNFLNRMPKSWKENIPMLTSASVAGIISHVKADNQALSRSYQPKDPGKPRNLVSFAEQLAISVKNKKPAMSELRFQQLQKSRTTDDFYRYVLRAVRLLDNKVNIGSLANDIIHWHREFDFQVEREPAKRLAVRWATDYFTALQNN